MNGSGKETPGPRACQHDNASDKSNDAQFKTVYLIRHGQSQGQVARKNARKNDSSLVDCGLTSVGRIEAEEIPGLLDGTSIELVVSSPMTRALNTAVLGFSTHDILVHYDLRELGSRIPENMPRPMNQVLKDIRNDTLERERNGVAIDVESLHPHGWPNPHSNTPRHDRIRMAFRWLYTDREEQIIAVVCHYNVIQEVLSDRLGRCSIRPQNAVPIACRLKSDGSLSLIN